MMKRKHEKAHDPAPKSRAYFLLLLGWLVYTTSYLGKVNYSANIVEIIDFYGVTKAQAGMVPTFFFFAYGVGQVLNGLLCKKYNIKWMVFGSLAVSAAINLVIAVSSNFSIIKWLWLVNGIALSVLWPTLIRLLSETLPRKFLGISSILMGTTVAVGTLIIYGLSAVYVAFDRFKLAFYTAGIVVIIVAALWLFFFNRAVKDAERERQTETLTEVKPQPTRQQKTEISTFFASVCTLCFCAVVVNLIKDGLTTWVPSILKEEFFVSDSLSILLTLFLPVLAVFGNLFAHKLHDRIPDYVNHCGVIFAGIAVLVGVIIGSMMLKLAALMLIGLVAVNYLASSLNSLITSIFPLFMRGKANAGLFAGILNGFCYVGSTISSYGLGAIADSFGWVWVFWTLLACCGAVFLVWGLYTGFRHSKNS